MTEMEPGSLEPDKRADVDQPGGAVPQAMETESARLLANKAASRLEAVGIDEREAARLADDYIARDLGEDVEGFVAWATERAGG